MNIISRRKKLHPKLHLPLAVALAFAAAGPGMAQQQQGGQQPEGGAQPQSQQQQGAQREGQGSEQVALATQQATREDEQFLKAAAQISVAEIKTGQLAMERGQSQEVKKLGETLARDHTKGLAQVLSTAVSMNSILPIEPTAEAQQQYEKLSGLSGEEFDREFAGAMVKGHEMAIELFTQEAESGRNMQVQQLAMEQLPVLKMHLEMAQMAAKSSGEKLGANSGR